VRRRILIAAVLGALVAASPARAAEPEWHSEQPVATGIGVPVPIGPVGDIAFWAPNRGALITAGNQGVPAGVYAYDGSGWYRYSTVCGGHGGSIAWVGPDEFWTVSDYAEPQEGNGSPAAEWGRTLCHFKDGEVVASYAEPLSSPAAYSRMNAAACEGPSDCWFAGERLPATAANQGAFHLHWDGGSPTPVPSQAAPEPDVANLEGSIEALAFYQGHLYESSTQAPFLHQIAAADPRRFVAVESSPAAGGPFLLATDPGQQQLWAVGRGGVVFRDGPSGFEAVPLAAELLGGRPVTAAAAEPGSEAAWVGGGGSAAELTRIAADGSLGPAVSLPQPGEELNDKGAAAQIDCPAPGQCWMATSKGWLFHLGGALPQDSDPALHRLVTFRPPDDSSRSFVPAGVPEDNSGEAEAMRPGESPLGEKFPHPRKRKALAYKIKQRLIGRNVLQLSFVLRAEANVRLLARRHEVVVAKTPKLTLAKGAHRIRLRLDPDRWPTSLDFQVHPAGKGSA
jgi:hypothetical protein